MTGPARVSSLRLRLFALILTPLVLMAVLLGYWRYSVAKDTAEELFDRTLVSAALAISRDIAVSGGDALSPTTSGLIRSASGGEVFYHATGPGGIYVTGFAYPPAVVGADKSLNEPQFSQALYRDEPVRVLRITERVTFETLTGDATVTVWQRMSDRNAFARELAVRAVVLMGALLLTLAVVVWFGVQRGLRPLIDLQQAISVRSPDDLSQIRRPVPVEAKGIVDTLNRLFGQVEASIQAHQVFISDAAHQLRNPAAAVQSMAEALQGAASDKDREQRIAELVSAARRSARIAEQLLSLDRLQQPTAGANFEPIDVIATLQDSCADQGALVLARGVDFELDAPGGPVMVLGDQVFLGEAIKNLIDNALKHGGPTLSRVTVQALVDEDRVHITVRDNGKGLDPAQSAEAFSRFSQFEPSEGSGLGLAIAMSVAEQHGGGLKIDAVDSGASLTLSLPRV